MKRKNNIIRLLPLLLLTLLVISCDKNRVYENYSKVPNNGWHKDSLAQFNVHIDDSVQLYNILIDVRNDINYNYSNLWLFITMDDSINIKTVDTLEVRLAKLNGEWLGEGSGGKKTLQKTFKQNVYFPHSGNYVFNIQQGMREDVLEGIDEVGLRIEKVE